MREVFSGGCACGAIRYEIPSEPVSQLHCQCRDCQRMSGTGHGSYLAFMGRSEVKLKGQAKHWDIVGDMAISKLAPSAPNAGHPFI